jgi:hypothetical protein
MYKLGSFEDELYRSMEKTIVKNQTENTHGFNKLAQAADLLNTAADIFDRAGMRKESEEVTKVLQSMAIDQLISEAFSLSDLMSKIDVLGVNEHDLHNLLEMSTPAQLIGLAKKIGSVLKGDSTLSEAVSNLAKEHDITDPEVKDKLVSQIMTALKVAKFFV